MVSGAVSGGACECDDPAITRRGEYPGPDRPAGDRREASARGRVPGRAAAVTRGVVRGVAKGLRWGKARGEKKTREINWIVCVCSFGGKPARGPSWRVVYFLRGRVQKSRRLVGLVADTLGFVCIGLPHVCNRFPPFLCVYYN
jgi:hypothetical protein